MALWLLFTVLSSSFGFLPNALNTVFQELSTSSWPIKRAWKHLAISQVSFGSLWNLLAHWLSRPPSWPSLEVPCRPCFQQFFFPRWNVCLLSSCTSWSFLPGSWSSRLCRRTFLHSAITALLFQHCPILSKTGFHIPFFQRLRFWHSCPRQKTTKNCMFGPSSSHLSSEKIHFSWSVAHGSSLFRVITSAFCLIVLLLKLITLAAFSICFWISSRSFPLMSLLPLSPPSETLLRGPR